MTYRLWVPINVPFPTARVMCNALEETVCVVYLARKGQLIFVRSLKMALHSWHRFVVNIVPDRAFWGTLHRLDRSNRCQGLVSRRDDKLLWLKWCFQSMTRMEGTPAAINKAVEAVQLAVQKLQLGSLLWMQGCIIYNSEWPPQYWISVDPSQNGCPHLEIICPPPFPP